MDSPAQSGPAVRWTDCAGADAVRPCRGPVRGSALPRRTAWRMGVTIATSHIAWRPCWRIVPSRFPPIDLFERIAEPGDWDALIALESLTNDRIRDEIGNIALVPPDERISGPGASVI